MAAGKRSPSKPRGAREIIEERQHTHGEYNENAYVNQTIKAFLRSAEGWRKLSYVQADAIDAISGKISRILSGNPNERDHWDDIAGYATLAADRCEDA